MRANDSASTKASQEGCSQPIQEHDTNLEIIENHNAESAISQARRLQPDFEDFMPHATLERGSTLKADTLNGTCVPQDKRLSQERQCSSYVSQNQQIDPAAATIDLVHDTHSAQEAPPSSNSISDHQSKTILSPENGHDDLSTTSPDRSDCMEVDFSSMFPYLSTTHHLEGVYQDSGLAFSPDLKESGGQMLNADILFVCEFYEQSFDIYDSVLERLKEKPGKHGKMRASATIGCARSSVTPSQLCKARDMLERNLLPWSSNTEQTPQFLLYRLLLGDVCRRQGNFDSMETNNDLAVRYYFAQRRSMNNWTQSSKIENLPLQYYLSQALSLQDQFGLAQDVKEQWTGGASCGSDQVSKPCLRSCLRWCIEEWKRDCSLSFVTLKEQSVRSFHRAGPHLAFCELWQRCIERSSSSAWIRHAERDTGMTPAELLFITCLTMYNALPAGSMNDMFVPLCDLSVYTPLRTLRGGVLLLAQSDTGLSRAVLDSFTSHHSNHINSVGRRLVFRRACLGQEASFTDASLFLSILHSCVVNLPDSKRSQRLQDGTSSNTGISQAIVHFDRDTSYRIPRMPLRSLPQTLNSSLQSSDLESVRSLRDRILKHAESFGKMSDTQLPSSAMPSSGSSSIGWVASFVMREASQVSPGMEWSPLTREFW